MRKPAVRFWAFLAGLALASGACSDPPVSSQEPPPVADAGASPSSDGGMGNCRWLGYGIGPLGAGQCDSRHLMVHSVRECSAEHGSANGSFRAIPDQCIDNGDEVQSLCCYAEGIPDASPPDSSSVLRDMLAQTDPPLSRADLLAQAAATCAQSGMRLGDWSLRYAADGTTPDLLRFQCK